MKNKDFDFLSYLSPFTWRYGSEEMRYIFSEAHKYAIWRRVWVAVAEVQHEIGLVNKAELADLKAHEKDLDINRIIEIEKETRHDVVAAIKEFAEKAKIGGGKIHLGATSMDVTDNTEMLRMQEALRIIEQKLVSLLSLLSTKVEKYAHVPCIGFTHLQPAEPTTVGYRFAFYTQELLVNYDCLQFVKQIIKGKGMKGAVGTAASYSALLQNSPMTPDNMEKKVMQKLGISAALITSQVYSRQYDYLVLTVLNSINASLAKFAADLRILQSPMFGEWSESFGKKQVGSSAMPFKKNPVNAEKVCSLARYVAHLPNIALENAAVSYLERTLDDSANRRIILPEAFLATDEIMQTAERVIDGLVINEKRIVFNLAQYAPFAATEIILMATVKQGANRQVMHEILREISLKAWEVIQNNEPNPMATLLMENKMISQYIPQPKIIEMLDARGHIGTAGKRSLQLLKQVKKTIKKYEK